MSMLLKSLVTTLAVAGCAAAMAQAAGAGADFNKKDREAVKGKTYSEEEIRKSTGSGPSGKQTDVRRVGQPTPSTMDKPAKK